MSHIDKVAITPFHSLDRYPNLKILEDFKDEKPTIFTKVSLPPEHTTIVNMKEFERFSFSPNHFVFKVFILFYVLFLVCYRPLGKIPTEDIEWQRDANGQVLHFLSLFGKFLLDMAGILFHITIIIIFLAML